VNRSKDRERPILAITMGDAAGIGPEIAVRALSRDETYETCRPVLIGDGSVVRATISGMGVATAVRSVSRVAEAEFTPGRIDLIDLHNVDLGELAPGAIGPMTGRAAYEFIVHGIRLATANEVDAVVTCPIHKESLNAAGVPFPGHTEILAKETGTTDYAMMLIAEPLRVILVTIHLSLKRAIQQIDPPGICRAIRHSQEAGRLLGIASPRIAVAGLNPHAGEGGMFGREEIEIIAPAVHQAQAEGIDVRGPLAADTVFHRARQGQFDVVVAMYHDQGLIPIKLMGFGRGVNVTLGLPIIRTSVDHGTAFGKAWQYRADEGSLLEALRVAATMARRRAGPGPTAQTDSSDLL